MLQSIWLTSFFLLFSAFVVCDVLEYLLRWCTTPMLVADECQLVKQRSFGDRGEYFSATACD